MRSISRRDFLTIAVGASSLLTGCSSEDGDKDDQQIVDNGSDSTEVSEEPETAEIGEPVTYVSATGDGEFKVTVDGLERSQAMTDDFKSFGDVTDGYSVCLLLLKIEDVSVEMGANEQTTLTKMWLEDADGVTIAPMATGYAGYGEYQCAVNGYFSVMKGQTVAIAIPYDIPDGYTEFTVSIDGTKVPVSLVEGNRPTV